MVRQLQVIFASRTRIFSGKQLKTPVIGPLDLEIARGEAVGILGPSGAGKSTLSLALTRLIESTGEIWLNIEEGLAIPLHQRSQAQLKPFRPYVQIVFQDALASLNPRMTAQDSVAEGLTAQGVKSQLAKAAAHAMLLRVGLPESHLTAYPQALSGGQRQRVCLARALVMQPKLLILDEATASLDRNTQLEIINLLRQVQRDHQVSLLVISHDRKLLNALCHRQFSLESGQLIAVTP